MVCLQMLVEELLQRGGGGIFVGALDLDGDGTLSADEFTNAIIEYWTSRDPEAPGNWWTGKPPHAL